MYEGATKVVALRKESVDRNYSIHIYLEVHKVALRKESVDRNGCGLSVFLLGRVSLSARRAWIEIGVPHRAGPQK